MFTGGAILSLVYTVVISPRIFPPKVIALAILAGLSFFIAVVAFFEVSRRGRLSISWTVIALAIVIPTSVSVLLWDEQPSSRQILGMMGVGVTFLLFGLDRGAKDPEGATMTSSISEDIFWVLMLALSFFTTGLVMVCNKALVQYSLDPYLAEYIFLYFSTAAISALILSLLRRSLPDPRGMKIGFAMSVGGFLAVIFMIQALRVAPGMVVFPIRSILNICFTVVLSFLLWRERVRLMGWLGLFTAGLSIFLMR